MKPLTFWQIEMIPWYLFAAHWATTWLHVKRTKTAETFASRLTTILPMVLAFELLFSTSLRVGPLRLRFVPAETRIAWSGIALTSLGVAIAIWARYCIGQYWSSRVTLKEGHRLTCSGPYAYVRHPIYTGMLLAAMGTAVMIGEWRGVLAVLVMWAAHSYKALREEALLQTDSGRNTRPAGEPQDSCFRASGEAVPIQCLSSFLAFTSRFTNGRSGVELPISRQSSTHAIAPFMSSGSARVFASIWMGSSGGRASPRFDGISSVEEPLLPFELCLILDRPHFRALVQTIAHDCPPLELA